MSDTSALQARIAELEIETTYQRETIESLNQTVTEHWSKIDHLSKMLDQIVSHLRIQKPGADTGGGEPPPPHY